MNGKPPPHFWERHLRCFDHAALINPSCVSAVTLSSMPISSTILLIGGLPAGTGRKIQFTGTTVLKVINGSHQLMAGYAWERTHMRIRYSNGTCRRQAHKGPSYAPQTSDGTAASSCCLIARSQKTQT